VSLHRYLDELTPSLPLVEAVREEPELAVRCLDTEVILIPVFPHVVVAFR
jgi:acyl carrier protein phosphodiesterase